MSEPFSTTVRVLERHKIRFTKEVYSRIPFLAGKTPETVSSLAIPGPFGGIQIIFAESLSAPSRSKIRALVKSGQAAASAADKPWMLLARYISNEWPLTLSFHDGRYTLVLPSTARDLGLVPTKEGEDALLFVCGEVLEIWSPQAWLTATGNARLRLTELIEGTPDP
jgi:hypothetical protein